MPEARSRGKPALPCTPATLHGSTPREELDDSQGSQMPEGKQWRRATPSTTSPRSPEKPGEPQRRFQATASPKGALGHLHGALAPAHS